MPHPGQPGKGLFTALSTSTARQAEAAGSGAQLSSREVERVAGLMHERVHQLPPGDGQGGERSPSLAVRLLTFPSSSQKKNA